ncbi:MAG: toxin-antitoxin system YwqK family antitoxin [Cryomorphaceae bacterium]|nr:toxin-antitoxin system YwqK family antitoxin [Cryomorphaceae bacterium]
MQTKQAKTLGVRILRGTSLLLIFLFSHAAIAQLNRIDDKGRKQGAWKKYHKDGKIVRYEGQFKDDIPVGTFRYYFPTGKLFTENVFRGTTGVCYSVQYTNKGEVIAEGLYKKGEKDSVWTFYDRHFNVISREEYKMGVLHGRKITYYEDGKVLESVHYENGEKNGPFTQYYENGKVHIKGTYANDQMHGEVRIFTFHGKKMAVGNYANGLKHENWIYFNDDGRPERKEIYRHGKLIKEQKY